MPSELAAALARVQAKLPHVAKGEKANVGQYSYEYADLTAVTDKIMPLLGEHGLAFTAWPTLDDGRFVLSYSLIHESGEERTGVYPLPEKGTPQQLGGHITYARRYALCAVTGVAPGGDDNDAAGAPEMHTDRPRIRTAHADAEHARLVHGTAEERLDQRPAQRGPVNVTEFPEAPPRRNGKHPTQIIAMHFSRLGVTDRTERLVKVSMLAGRTEPVASSKEIDDERLEQISDVLASLKDRAALDALLDAKRSELPS